MRQKCDTCGEYKFCNDKGECFDCIQDCADLAEWVPEDGYDGDEELEEDEVE